MDPSWAGSCSSEGRVPRQTPSCQPWDTETYMCWEALGKNPEYWGAESSGPWGAAWLMTMSTGLCGYIFLDVRKKLMLLLVMRSVR